MIQGSSPGTGSAIWGCIMTTKILALGFFLLAACAPGSAYQKESGDGYCFKAEGLNQSRCYAEYESCSRKLSSVQNHTRIESECHFQSPGVLSVKSVAKTMSSSR